MRDGWNTGPIKIIFAQLNIVSFVLQHLAVQTDHEGVQGECGAAAHRCPTESCSTGEADVRKLDLIIFLLLDKLGLTSVRTLI